MKEPPKARTWKLRRHSLTLITGLLVAATACILPWMSQQQTQSETQKRLYYAYMLRCPDIHQHYLDSLVSTEIGKLQLARDGYLDQEYQTALSNLRFTQEGENTRTADDDNFQKDLEQNLLYSVMWPEKISAWLSVELDGEKDHVLIRVIDPWVGIAPRNLRLELLGWRNQRYRPLEAEPFGMEGQPRREAVLPIRNLITLAAVNVHRPKEGSKGQVFVSYLSEHRDYVGDVYLLKDGHLRRFRWVSSRPVTIKQDRLQVFNADLQKTESWGLSGEKWHAGKAN